MSDGTVLAVSDLTVRRGSRRVVDGVSFKVRHGETLGVIGESGCGKSTLARGLLRLLPLVQGEIQAVGRDWTRLSPRALRRERRHVQAIFQDPGEALDPRMQVGRQIEEPLSVHGVGDARERRQRVRSIMERLDLNPDWAERLPRELSGGQRQRVGIARALVVEPELVIADEPWSALDSVTARTTLDLFKNWQREHGTSYLVMGHDLRAMVRASDRIMVMYLGRLVEIAPVHEFWQRPKHPYSVGLLQAVPRIQPLSPTASLLPGEADWSQTNREGCRFAPRCPQVQPLCNTSDPRLTRLEEDHWVACHFPE